MQHKFDKIDWVFPAPVWRFHFENYEEYNRKMEKNIYELRESFPGKQRSNGLGWHSGDEFKLHEMAKPLLDEIKEAFLTVANHSKLSYSSLRLNAWANINPPGAFNFRHVHPGSHYSGAYYIKVPPGCGDLRFQNPLAGYYKFGNTEPTPCSMDRYLISPEEGQLVMFRSNLEHTVLPNMSQEDRISIGFNVTGIK
ncbi:hypothetical protein CL634_07135 [bacterium]|nr:hypothetical protein [bacterium]